MEQKTFAYSKDDQIILTSVEKDKFFYSRKSLSNRSKTIENLLNDCPKGNEIELALSSEQLSSILFYIDTLQAPSNDEDWISILYAADYLDFRKRQEGLLHLDAIAYISKKKGKVVANVTILDLVRKIKDPDYLTDKEIKILAEQEEAVKKEKERLARMNERQAIQGPQGPIWAGWATGVRGGTSQAVLPQGPQVMSMTRGNHG